MYETTIPLSRISAPQSMFAGHMTFTRSNSSAHYATNSDRRITPKEEAPASIGPLSSDLGSIITITVTNIITLVSTIRRMQPRSLDYPPSAAVAWARRDGEAQCSDPLITTVTLTETVTEVATLGARAVQERSMGGFTWPTPILKGEKETFVANSSNNVTTRPCHRTEPTGPDATTKAIQQKRYGTSILPHSRATNTVANEGGALIGRAVANGVKKRVTMQWRRLAKRSGRESESPSRATTPS